MDLRRAWRFGAGALLLLGWVVAGCGGGGATGTDETHSSDPESAGPPPPPVPTSSIYFGASVNPTGEGASTPAGPELSQLPTFEEQVGGTPAILHVYVKLTSAPPVSALEEVAARGAVPMLDVACSPLTQVLSGSLDETFTNWALALRQYGNPVFFRWFREMNLPDKSAEACLGNDGPSMYVAAWRRIWGIFQRVGTSNVSFVWSPGATPKSKPDGPFFPGVAYVDWISVDTYLYPYILANHSVDDIENLISPWYNEWSAYRSVPLMISEIAAPQGFQAPLLKLLSTLLPTKYHRVRALVYFDAPGAGVQWALDAEGLTEFGALLSSQYFSFHLSQ